MNIRDVDIALCDKLFVKLGKITEDVGLDAEFVKVKLLTSTDEKPGRQFADAAAQIIRRSLAESDPLGVLVSTARLSLSLGIMFGFYMRDMSDTSNGEVPVEVLAHTRQIKDMLSAGEDVSTVLLQLVAAFDEYTSMKRLSEEADNAVTTKAD